jgi:transposase
MDAWSSAGGARGEPGEWVRRLRTHARGHEVRAAEGYAWARPGWAQGSHEGWTERVMVVRSPRHATHQAAGWAKRLRHAATALAALTPPRGRGKRQSPEAATLGEAMDLVRTAHRVEGRLSGAWDTQVARHTRSLGRGRGAASRPQRGLEPTRSPITRIARQEDTIAGLRPRCGWQALVTNARPQRRALAAAVVCSRHAYRVERVCNRLQGRRQIAPRCVKRTDHIAGRTSLLTLGVRGVTVTAFVLRRSLEQEQTSLPGLPPEHKRKRTDTPTAERLLPAFSGVSLTIIQSAAGEDILRRIPPLAGVQEALLHRLGLGTHLYRQLARAKVSPKPWDWRSLHEIGWCFPGGAHLQGASPP